MRRNLQQSGDHALRPMVGCRINTYIPDRITEGYGLNEAGLCAIKEAKHCRELGMDLIVTDHALNADGILSEAIAVVNPHIPSPYPFANLCGAGGAFALLVATRKVLRERGFFKRRP